MHRGLQNREVVKKQKDHRRGSEAAEIAMNKGLISIVLHGARKLLLKSTLSLMLNLKGLDSNVLDSCGS
jgi:hypothetical protein